MSDGLTTYRLGDLCDLRAGSVFKPELQGKSSGDYPFIKVSDMNLSANQTRIREANNWITEDDREVIKAKTFPPGTTVFAKIGEALKHNRLRLITQNTIIDNNMMGAIPRRDRVDAGYFCYALSKFDFGAIAGGTALPYLTVGTLKELLLDIPSVEEQRVIAHILGTLDDKIELNRRINETLEAMARAIFKSWFVDFDPVRAKASGEPPESICRRLGLSPDVLALFPDSFQDSEFGEIPASWYISTLATEAKRFGGFIQTGPFGSQLHAADYVDEGVPVVMPQDLVNRRISVERIARVTAEMAQRLSRHSVKPGDVVYSRRGDVERHALVSEREAGWLCGTGCLLVRLGDAWPSQAYLSEVLDLPVTREWLVRHAVGATMPNLNTTILGNMPFLIPSESLLHAFESIAGPLRKLQIDKCVESDLLAVTRDTLLPKLLSGELSPNHVSVESLP